MDLNQIQSSSILIFRKLEEYEKVSYDRMERIGASARREVESHANQKFGVL